MGSKLAPLRGVGELAGWRTAAQSRATVPILIFCSIHFSFGKVAPGEADFSAANPSARRGFSHTGLDRRRSAGILKGCNRMSRPVYCPDCGARFDAFGICPNASPQDVTTMRGFASCGKGHYLTPLSVWSVLAACGGPDHARDIQVLPALHAEAARGGGPRPIAA
jgi:hypothetical protein